MLYLDTARLGRMSPSAQAAHRHYVQLAGEEAASLYFEHFLRFGVEAWPDALRRRYRGLAGWQGVRRLKDALRRLVGALPNLPVFLAGRSAQLMRLAARVLFQRCENVLVTDTGRPSYHAILEQERRQRCRTITSMFVRDLVLRERATEEEIVGRIVSGYTHNKCHGLFLTAVSNDGIRLPVRRIVHEVRSRRELCLVVVDGAQEYCQGYADLRQECVDFYLAGCHKWLGAFNPMGLGFFGRRNAHPALSAVLEQVCQQVALDDPLLRFTEQLESDSLDGYTETVNLTPLFSCQGAVLDQDCTGNETRCSFQQRLDNGQAAAIATRGTSWRPLVPRAGFRSGILLLQGERRTSRQAPPEAIRAAFQARGVVLTAYDNGLIRLSMPAEPWQRRELHLLRKALGRIS